MSKHTAGPWTFDKAHSVGFIVHDKNYGYIVGAQDEEGRYGAIESESNARLIAAAPELLEALEEMTSLASGPVGGVSVQMKRDILAKARAVIAIAKARGEV